MKELIKNFKTFDRFLKDQLMIGLYIQCTWALVTPLVHKLQGMLWSTTYISVYLIMMRMSGLIVPYFKGTHIKVSYRNIIFLNFLYVIGTCLYFYDQNVFLWADAFGLSHPFDTSSHSHLTTLIKFCEVFVLVFVL